MRHVFRNDTPQSINRLVPTDVSSAIAVSGLNGRVQHVNVAIHLSHTYTQDLRISLIEPGGQEVLLVGGAGGSGDNFFWTVFDDGSSTPIAQAFPPFSGVFHPQQSLSAFNGLDPNGTWSLRVVDTAFMDGGTLHRWGMALTVPEVNEPQSAFSIEVRFLGGLTAGQRSVFDPAAARWSEIIIGDLPSFSVDGEVIDDILIEASGASLDGVGGTLGRAAWAQTPLDVTNIAGRRR